LIWLIQAEVEVEVEVEIEVEIEIEIGRDAPKGQWPLRP
jgi:hypothetical protein